MRKKELEKVWKQLDGACEALDRLMQHDEGLQLLKNHENRIDFSAIVNLKNEVEELIESKTRNKKEDSVDSVTSKITFHELKESVDSWKEAVIVFTEDTFTKVYSELQRSYKVRSDAKYFDGNMIGNSLFGDCLDGSDNGVRLDYYMGEGWKVEYCYIVKGVNDNE